MSWFVSRSTSSWVQWTAVTGPKKATKTIPIVLVPITDPLGLSWWTAWRGPGGNVTGFYYHGGGLAGKRLELLKEPFPSSPVSLFSVNPKESR